MSQVVSTDITQNIVGVIEEINGPIAVVRDVRNLKMMEVVKVSKHLLIGEVISVSGEKATIQIYENTAGVRPGDYVYGTGEPLSVELGPGLISKIYDGIQRPLDEIYEYGIFIPRGVDLPSLNRERRWYFKPLVRERESLRGGSVIGEVAETTRISHKILVPPDKAGTVIYIANEGEYKVDDVICILEDPVRGRQELKMYHKWPVKIPRPINNKYIPNEAMFTGQRVIDFLFPIARGGTASIPGGFGTGKTVTQHQLARWSDADIIIYVGCGERGNEITEVLEDFPKLVDPKTGRPLMERTVIIANTSNMPVTAREASIYTGITIGEYFRDMGYNVALMADSTSRWAEALRELSGRLEEMPAEEGFPAYLGSRLAAFYERAGFVETLNGDRGSLTIIGAVSPAGGDFSEPVTQNTKRFTKCFWALDKSLASQRHFPSINWMLSYSFYVDMVSEWWNKIDPDYKEVRQKIMDLLIREDRLQKIVKIVGLDALPQSERLVLEVSRIIRVGFLQQVAYDKVDSYCSPQKQIKMAKLILKFYDLAHDLVVNYRVPVSEIQNLKSVSEIIRIKIEIPNDQLEKIDEIEKNLISEIEKLKDRYS
ncbi:MAG: V-type ATP synthase subunit A [Brevinematales bacterium]|nr:V-type ATP synthase subunit A [Brevinematales bacterium]